MLKYWEFSYIIVKLVLSNWQESTDSFLFHIKMFYYLRLMGTESSKVRILELN